MTELDDLGLRLPINGVQLIEASAGTGKTFTLATLYARLVIEIGLPVSAILAVTFSEAATKELRERLRERLVLARQLVESALALKSPGDTQAPVGALDPDGLPCTESEKTRLTRILVDAAVAREGAAMLCRRLRLACEQMDLAPIHTIHGFCHRALADHALEAGQALLERELLENEAALRREVAVEFWREHSRDADGASTLGAIWSSPDALAASLRELVVLDVLEPAPQVGDGQALAALRAARAKLADTFREHGANARALLRQALAEHSLHVPFANDVVVDRVWHAMQEWLEAPLERDPPATAKVENYASSKLRTKTISKKATPVSPLFDAIETWHQRQQQYQIIARQQRIALVHLARDFARRRFDELKRERGLLGYDDMIRGVADALDGAGGDQFAQRLQAQYAVALLDEFQDTDARQWAIFHRLFSAPANAGFDTFTPRALVLIGDPKQAIYRFRGGDVFTYLAAERRVDGKYHLACNFRSRPLLLAGVQALFELSGPDAFAQAGIAFEAVQAGGRCLDAHLQIDGANAPALNFLVLVPGEEEENIESARQRATQACVGSIHDLLAAGLGGRATLCDRHGVQRHVAPGDIAVLVARNDDAKRIQEALARAGIPSVAAGRSSLYQTEEAQHLCWLFEALLAPGNDQRLRAALASPLFGLDAAMLAGFDSDESSHRHWQDRLQHWQQRAQRYGPMALLGELCAENAARLLNWRDGERRLSNYLQLAEELQAADAHTLGLAGLLDELERRMEDADDQNEAELLRLESDAARVKILTLHRSKGLEFDLVFLPYLATGGADRPSDTLKLAKFHNDERRVALLFSEKTDVARLREADEERAEQLRLLYVGLTRARLATWAIWGAVKEANKTAMAWLVQRAPGADAVDKITQSALDERLRLLQSRAPDAISVQLASVAVNRSRLTFAVAEAPPQAALARRVLDRDWWVYSFSQLAREDTGVDARGADDEIDAVPDIAYSRFSGTRFGNSLHSALEKTAIDKWLDWSGLLPPPGEFEVLANALRQQGYNGPNDLDEGVPLLTRLISETLNVRLPEGTRLAALSDATRRNEMEFHFAMAPTRIAEILELLHSYGVIAERQAFGFRQRLEGLLTGRIDLIYEVAGRYYLLDYKSNQLRTYTADSLALAVRDSEYDLQYVLYSLALHRWLRFKLGSDYNINHHLGGVRYLFCRGLDQQSEDSPGIHALTLPPALIEALDTLLRPEPA